MPRLRHLAIVTLDTEKLAKFYTEVFGMEVLSSTPGSGIFLTDGTINLAILPNRAEGKPNGINHIGFHIEDTDEIAGRIAEWNLSAPAERPATRPYAETRITDPDGNNIDLSVHGFDTVELKSDREKKAPEKVDS
jgi:catechol 2,3-dioxygenase-like lactoylglutathione lyase family enzyme